MDVRRTTGLALLHSVVLWLWTVLSGSDSYLGMMSVIEDTHLLFETELYEGQPIRRRCA